MMKYLDINEQLDELIIQYGIDRYHPRFAKCKKARMLIREFLNKYSEKEIILVTASTTDSNYILEDCRDFLLTKDIVLYEQMEEYPWKSIEVNCPVVIVSFYGRREAAARLYCYGVTPQSIYDYIYEGGIILEGNYYDVFGEEYHTYQTGKPTFDYAFLDMNAIFFYDRRNYEMEETVSKKEIYLARMIFDCVYVKDWELTEKYIREYLKLEGNAAGQYEEFLQKVKRLLVSIKEVLAAKRNDDIVMFWLDALEYGEDKDMPYLDSLSEKSIDFVNAYTVTPYTHSTAKTLFDHKYIVDDRAYKIKIDKSSSFIHNIEERGFVFRFYTMLREVESNLKGRIYQNLYTPFSQVCWDAISDMLKSDKKMCIVIHEILATHSPYISFGLTGEEYFFLKESTNILSDFEKRIRDRQAVESRKYIDDVLKFYSGLLPENVYKIYMSDHGHTGVESFHTIFRIVYKNMVPQRIKDVFSYINFDKLIYKLLEKSNDFSEVVGEYAKIQDVDYSFKDTLKLYLYRNEYSVSSLWGYKGIVTRHHRYIRYNDGREVYYNNGFDQPPMTKEKVEQLRQLCTEYPEDIIEDEKFRYTRNLYATYRNYLERNGVWEAEKRRLISTLFDELSDSINIAVRGGGKHTWELWFALKQKARDKIVCVIDSNPKCLAAKIGIKVIGMDDIVSNGVDTVVISSYKNEMVWYDELKNVTKNVRIIGLYNYLEKNGIHCNMEFYKPEFIKEDIIWEE